jgi:penicillin-binding protein 1A
VGNEQDYDMNNNDYIGPESRPVPEDENKNTKKDTVVKTPVIKEDDKIKPADTPVKDSVKKKGLLKRIFGGKENP